MLSLSQPDARPAPVLFDELHTSSFERSLDGVKRQLPRLVSARFKLADRHDAYNCGFGKIRLTPIQ